MKTSEPLTAAQLEELGALLETAETSPPWECCTDDNVKADWRYYIEAIRDGHPTQVASELRDGDAALIVALRNTAPALLAAARERDRLREEAVSVERAEAIAYNEKSLRCAAIEALIKTHHALGCRTDHHDAPGIAACIVNLARARRAQSDRLAKLEAVAKAARTLTDTADDAEIELPHAHRDSCITYADKHSSCDCGYETGESLRDGTDALRKALAALKETP